MSDVIEQIDALLALDEAGALVPHGIGGLARRLLTDCRDRLEVTDEKVKRAMNAHDNAKAAHDEWVSEQGMRAALTEALR